MMTILAADLDLVSMLGFTGTNVVLVAITGWVLKVVLENQLKQSISHEYTKKLEAFHRAQRPP